MSILTKKFHNKDLQTLVIDAQDSAETVLSLIDELEDTMLLQSLKKSQKDSCEIVEARDGNAVDSGQVETAKDNGEGASNELETVHIDESIEAGCEDAAPIHSGNNGQRSQERGDSNKKKGEGPSEQELVDIVEAQDTNAVDSGQVESAKDNGERPSNDQGRVREVPSIHSGKQSTRNGEGRVERCESGKKKVKEDIKNYTSRKCPLCKKSVCILKRHIIDVHVRKNECLPLFRVPALVQMAIHGDHTRGGKVVKENDGAQKVYRRRKAICPKCDHVVLYLSTHLQRTHRLNKLSEEYQTLMNMARRYQGKKAELQWDQQIIERRRKKNGTVALTTRRKCSVEVSSYSDSSEEPARGKKVKSGLQILAEEELASDTSDESFYQPAKSEIPQPMDVYSQSSDENDIPNTETQEHEEERCAEDDVPTQEGQVGEYDGDGKRSSYSKESTTGSEQDQSSDEEYDERNSSGSDSEDSEDVRASETWKEYYSKGKANSPMEKLLILFCQHLQNILGGCKRERHAIQHAQSVRKVMESIDSKSPTLECVIAEGGTNIWKWAKPLLDAKKVRPGTVRSSITSLVKFLEFCVDHTEHKVKGMPFIDDKTIQVIKQVIPRVVAMGSSVNQLFAHEKWEQIMEDQTNKVSTEDTAEMINSAPAKQAISLLLKASTVKLTESEFLTVRDFLIARLGLENGQRPGPLEMARILDFQRLEKKGDKFMFVSRHKRSKAGPAPLTMSANLKSNLEVYLKSVRPAFANEDEEAIFVLNSGKAFPAGTIGKRITEWWRKATGKSNINSTRLRKMHSSGLHKADPVDKRSAHRLMCHSSRTADTYYMIHDLGEVAAHGHSVLADNLQLKDTVHTEIADQPSPKEESSPSNDLTKEQMDDN